nr:hypothetical protein [Tanacetum cinerariifolium]
MSQRTTLLIDIPEDHLAKFHKTTDAKEMWEAIKSRFGGNDESKKMYKYLLKQQFESFYVSNSEGLYKGYDRFQSLLSQLETHGAGVSTEDANKKFFWSLPSSWSRVSLIMRTKPRVDTLNLMISTKILESLNMMLKVLLDHLLVHRMWHLFLLKTLAVLMKLIAFGVSTTCGHNSQKEGSSSYIDDLISKGNHDSRKRDARNTGYKAKDNGKRPKNRMNIKLWSLLMEKVVMIFTRLKKFYKKTERKLHFDAKEPVGFNKSKVECFNCYSTEYFARECRSKGNHDSRKRDAGNTGYKAKDNGKRPKNRMNIKLWSLLMEKMSAKDKSGLGYRSQIHDGVLSYENEVFASVFDSRSSDVEDSHVNDRFAKVEGMHAVPPPMTGNYMPPKSDFEIDDSSEETLETVAKPVESKPKVVNEPKVWSDAPIIEEYELDSDDEYVSKALVEQEKPSCAFINTVKHDNPHQTLKGKGIVDSGCSRHMTENKAYLVDYQDFNNGHVAFGDTECLVLSPDFKLPDENQILLRVPRQHNMYSFNLENIVPSVGLACLIAKATIDESTKWHGRCDNGIEFKNMDIIEFCGSKGIKEEYSNARNPQQNEVAERKNKTLIEAARTMLADLFVPNTFWVEAVSTVCYVLNRVLVTKPQNKTPYELLTGKFKEKYDEGFLVGYSLSSKAFRRIKLTKPQVQKKLIIVQSSKAKNGDEKLNEDTDSKTNEEPVDKKDQAFLEELKRLKRQEKKANDETETLRKMFAQSTKDLLLQAGAARASSTNYVNTSHTQVNAASTPLNTTSIPTNQDDCQIPSLEDIYEVSKEGIFTSASYNEGAVAEFINLETTVNVSPILTSRIHSIHPTTQILRDLTSAVQTRSKVNKSSRAHAFISQALKDESWVDAMQEELLQFKIQKVWILVDLPFGKKAIGTKWVYRNKKDERGVVVRNKARTEAIRIILAFASYMGFIVYQIDVKVPSYMAKLIRSGYRRGLIHKTLFIKKDKKDIMLVQVYVDDIIFGSTKKSWCDEFEALMKNRFQMSSMGEITFFLRLQVKQKEDGIFISHDKYVVEILKKFDFLSVKTASTPIETKKPLVKDEEAADVDVHLYRSMIGFLMYLTVLDLILCLWYPRESAFDLEAYSHSDYAGVNLDRKSTTGGCQFFGRRLISWQCKKQTILATLTTKAEYVAAASYCGQVKTVNDEVRIQALVDGKRVNIKECSIRRTLRLDDAEGDMAHHKEIFDTPSLTKKVFANMKRVGILQADAQSIPITTEPSTSKSQKKHKQKRKHTQEYEVPPTESPVEQSLPSPSSDPLPSGEDSLKLKELTDLCTNLSNKVLEFESRVIDIKSTYQERIEKLKDRVERLEEENRVLKELKSVPSTDDVDEHVMENRRGKYYYCWSNKNELNEGVKVSETEVRQEKDVEVESSKREGENLEQEIAKKQKIVEETEELKKHLQIVTNADDDVYTYATPLASKIPILITRFILKERDLTSRYLELMEIIYRFEKTKPKNYSDDYLLNTLKIMFETANVETSVWKDQKGRYGLAKVKSWKLIESCRVHCITFLSTQIFLLVERMYSLTHFTLEQMLNNVRLQVNDESEMSPELLRLFGEIDDGGEFGCGGYESMCSMQENIGVIGKSVRVMSMGSSSCVEGGGATLGGSETTMEDEEVAMVDGIFEGAFGALGDESWCLGLEVKALVDTMESKPNGKLIHNSIINGPYVRRIILEPGDTNQEVPVNETFHVQTNDELTKKELKQIEADDQAIQTILLGLPEDIYAAVDKKKAKLFNEWEMFTSNEEELIESYYHRFLKLMNDLKRNKHFPEKIASNLKFLNNFQPKWSRHVTIVNRTKDLHTADYSQLYDFLKYNQNEVDELKAERLAKTQDPLALTATSTILTTF